MNKNLKNIIIASIIASLITYYFLKNNKKKHINEFSNYSKSSEETIKKGDLSKEVSELQILINKLFGKGTLEVTGAYDKKTRDLVKLIFYNTNELTNIELGEVTVRSVSFLNKLLDNIQSKKDE